MNRSLVRKGPSLHIEYCPLNIEYFLPPKPQPPHSSFLVPCSIFPTIPFTRLFHCSLANPDTAPVATAAFLILSSRIFVPGLGFSLRPYTPAVILFCSRFTRKVEVAASLKKCAMSC